MDSDIREQGRHASEETAFAGDGALAKLMISAEEAERMMGGPLPYELILPSEWEAVGL